jgi:uncharacterized paraquat-inducible protein A
VSDKKPVKKISAKAIMTDLKAGMSDTELMGKYNISFQGLQDLFGKLVDAKLATRAYFDNRARKQVGLMKKQETNRTCPYCGYTSAEQFTRCPRCHNDVSDWLDTVELTKILTGSFE